METLNLIFEHGLHFAQCQLVKSKWHPHEKCFCLALLASSHLHKVLKLNFRKSWG